jgi:hypothetical protein
MKIEAQLKQQFTKELKRQLPGAVVLQYATNGAPDREVVYNGISTRWEFKHATPRFESPGIQELMCARLGAVSHCRYVIWHQWKDVKRTLIVQPQSVIGQNGSGRNIEPEAFCSGFDMQWLVNEVRKAHGV